MSQTSYFRTTLRLLPGLLLFPILLLGGTIGWLVAQEFRSQPPAPTTAATTRDDRWRQDIDALVEHITQRHSELP